MGRVVKRIAEGVKNAWNRLPLLGRRVPEQTSAAFRIQSNRFLSKLEGTLGFQKICQANGISFETAAFYHPTQPFSLKPFIGADRILVRTEGDRREFILKDKDPNAQSAIERTIKEFTMFEPFIVQCVGLREDIQRYGAIVVQRNEKGFTITVWNHRYTKPNKSEEDVFLQKLQIIRRLRVGQEMMIRPRDLWWVEQQFGNPNVGTMLEQLARRNEFTQAKFVQYAGKKPCFYDMSGTN